MDWIKLYTRKWLWGSGRTMAPEKRGVWVDLLAMAAEAKLRDGTLRFDVDRPMSRDYIAGVLQVDRHLLDVCIEAFKADINADNGKPRVNEWADGTLEITNWYRFQDGKSKPKTDEPDFNGRTPSEIQYFNERGYFPNEAWKHRQL